MKKKLVIVLTPLILFLLVWGISLVRCEILTLIHGSEFENLFDENVPIDPPKYLKILNYSNKQARIYCVSEGNTMGNVLVFTKKDGKWKFKEWRDTVWSTSGNADDVIWPYWWHFFYSHQQIKN